MARRHAEPCGGFDAYRGIYLKRIPTYSFPLMLSIAQEPGIDRSDILDHTSLTMAQLERDGTLVSFLQALKFLRRLIKLFPRTDLGPVHLEVVPGDSAGTLTLGGATPG